MENNYTYENIDSILEIQSQRFQEKIAIESDSGESITYKELNEITKFLALEIESTLKKDFSSLRISIVIPNGILMSTVLLACARYATAMPLNPKYQTEEFQSYIKDLQPDVILVNDNPPNNLLYAAKKLNIRTLKIKNLDALKNSPNNSKKTSLNTLNLEKNIALILMTSGSTGKSKKVPLTHKNICTSISDICRSLNLTDEDICLSMWEQFHIGGLVDLLLVPIASGGKIISTKGFDATSFFHLTQNMNPTWFQAVPTSFHEILHVGKKISPPINHRYRFIRAVASALPETLQIELENFFQVPFLQTYGMTEASPLITTNTLLPNGKKLGSVGKSCGPEIKIINNKYVELGIGEVGQICIKGNNVFHSYENNKRVNELAFNDGWFLTGDNGYLDQDSFLYLTGRIKEEINRGGEKINPFEVDEALSKHPKISQSATFSIPHPTLGEDIATAIILKDNSTNFSPEEIQNFLKKNLIDFKIPKTILILEELPKNAIGKIQKDTLSAIAISRNNTSLLAKPENKLQELISFIWSMELEVQDIGVDQDFIALGGDSLSSVRLLAAIENLLGIKLPNEEIINFKTIRSMADHIYKRKLLNFEEAGAILDKLNENDIRSAFIASSIDDNGNIIDRSYEDFESNHFKLKKEATLNILTPSEVIKFIETNNKLIDKKIDSIVPEIQFPNYIKWSKKTFNEITKFHYHLNWTRSKVNEDIYLYSNGLRNKNRNLIVAFAGNAMRLMMPMYQFLGILSPENSDLLFLRDVQRLHYENGMRNLADDIPSLCLWLNNYVKENKYNQVISIGTSGGGLISIYAALTNLWVKGIAICPDSIHKNPKIKQLFLNLAEDKSPKTKTNIFYGELNERDKASALDAKEILTNTKFFADSTCSSHSLLYEILIRGNLKSFFEGVLKFND
jgi:acyl-CoA synthetase (AMP-forming)/AMP-acid ligase II/acyl carrier protein